MASAPDLDHRTKSRVAIIGSGFGGLAAALRLQAAGYSTVIFEARDYLERNWGVCFPRGGTGALVQGMLRLYRELGGELRLSSKVMNLSVELHDGRTRHLVSKRAQRREVFDLSPPRLPGVVASAKATAGLIFKDYARSD